MQWVSGILNERLITPVQYRLLLFCMRPSRRDFVVSRDPATIAVESIPSMTAVSLAYRAFVSSPVSYDNVNQTESKSAPEKVVIVPDFPSHVFPNTLPSKNPPNPPSLSGRRFRKSFTYLRHTAGTQPMHLPLDGTQTFNISPEATAAAATMRWAAARVNLSPLALPSPEHELTDPMRGVHAAIPGSHPAASSPPAHPSTPGMSRIRVGSFWEGTQDVEDESTVPSLPGSLPRTPLRIISEREPPQASVPLQRSYSPEPTEEGDYFTADYANHRRDSGHLELTVCTAPPLPRRICLTRQTSSPLPESNVFVLSGLRRRNRCF